MSREGGVEERGEEVGKRGGRLFSTDLQLCVREACIPWWWRSLYSVNYGEHSSISSPHGSTTHRSPKDRTALVPDGEGEEGYNSLMYYLLY